MKQSLKEIRLLLIRLSIALLTYPLCKTIFFLFNYSYFSDVSFYNFLSILFFGLRFDVSALVLINSPFIVLHIIPFAFTRKKWYQIVLKSVFLTVNSLAILADCIDLEYYKYTMKRITADFFDLFGLGSDISTMLPQYIRDFWYIILIWISLTVLIGWLYRLTVSPIHRFSVSESRNRRIGESEMKIIGVRILSWLTMNSLLIGLCIIAFRGGLQLRPIMPINASEYVSAENIPLIINTPFSIIKSFDLEKLEEKKYFSEEELLKHFNPIHQPSTISHQPSLNVFIIIMESFSKEYTSLGGKKSYTPFLDSLMNESLVFDNAFANGKKSIEGIPAILAGIPALANESYIISAYGSNQFTSIANTLKKKGYSSAFFHGGTKGTMGFDAFCSAAGFDNYYGRIEYNNEKDYDGDWGIWDEEFFQYTKNNVSRMENPFLAVLFSLSSHHPSAIPEKYGNQFTGGKLPILKSVEYADFSLRKFFETASKETWFDNTLFVITADHTGPSTDPYYSNNAGIFKIPIIFYKHNNALKGINHYVAQHIDILPTVLNYLNYDKDFFVYGNNLLDTADTGYAINYINGFYQIFLDDYLLQFDGNKSFAFFNYRTDSLLQSNLIGSHRKQEKKMETKLKAIIQLYNDGMIHNRMTAENFK